MAGLARGLLLVAECTLYTFWDTIIPYRTESVHFLGAYELSNYVLCLQCYGLYLLIAGSCY